MATLLDKIENRQTAAREAALGEYRKLLARSHSPEQGDDTRVLELLAPLGIAEPELRADLDVVRQWREARTVAHDDGGELAAIRAALQQAEAEFAAICNPLKKQLADAEAELRSAEDELNRLGLAQRPDIPNTARPGAGSSLPPMTWASGPGVAELHRRRRIAMHDAGRAEVILRYEAEGLYGQTAVQAREALRQAEQRRQAAAWRVRDLRRDHPRALGLAD